MYTVTAKLAQGLYHDATVVGYNLIKFFNIVRYPAPERLLKD